MTDTEIEWSTLTSEHDKELYMTAFGIDYHGVLHYEEDLLREIIEEHKPLFNVLLAMEES